MKYIISHFIKPTKIPENGTSSSLDYLITDPERQGYTTSSGKHLKITEVIEMLRRGELFEVKKLIYLEDSKNISINSKLEIRNQGKKIGFFFSKLQQISLI